MKANWHHTCTAWLFRCSSLKHGHFSFDNYLFWRYNSSCFHILVSLAGCGFWWWHCVFSFSFLWALLHKLCLQQVRDGWADLQLLFFLRLLHFSLVYTICPVYPLWQKARTTEILLTGTLNLKPNKRMETTGSTWTSNNDNSINHIKSIQIHPPPIRLPLGRLRGTATFLIVRVVRQSTPIHRLVCRPPPTVPERVFRVRGCLIQGYISSCNKSLYVIFIDICNPDDQSVEIIQNYHDNDSVVLINMDNHLFLSLFWKEKS